MEQCVLVIAQRPTGNDGDYVLIVIALAVVAILKPLGAFGNDSDLVGFPEHFDSLGPLHWTISEGGAASRIRSCIFVIV